MLQELSRQHQAHRERRARLFPKQVPIVQRDKPSPVPIRRDPLASAIEFFNMLGKPLQPMLGVRIATTYARTTWPYVVAGEKPPVEKTVSVPEIVNAAARFYERTTNEIMSDRRSTEIVRARHVAMYLAKLLTRLSLPEIGRQFGGRDHTTPMHAVRKIQHLMGFDLRLVDEVEALRLELVALQECKNRTVQS